MCDLGGQVWSTWVSLRGTLVTLGAFCVTWESGVVNFGELGGGGILVTLRGTSCAFLGSGVVNLGDLEGHFGDLGGHFSDLEGHFV